jgi:putative ABC transport system permease protein
MSWFKSLFPGLRTSLRSWRVESDIDEEFRFHVETRTQENIDAGMTPGDAKEDAAKRFGDFVYVKDLCREIRGGGLAETFWQDIRYSFRMLLKSPSVTVAAVLALALGIGVNSTVFSVVSAALLSPLPYKDSDRLVKLWGSQPQKTSFRYPVSAPDFIDWRDENQVFEHLAAFTGWPCALTGAGEPEMVQGIRVSAHVFSVLDIKPALGRTLLPEDERPDGTKVVVISYDLWQRRFGSDSTIIGQTLSLNDKRYVVVGVMPQNFQFPHRGAELWVPIAFTAEDLNRAVNSFQVIGRLKFGVTVDQAQAAMSAIAGGLERQYAQTNNGRSVKLVPLREDTTWNIRPGLLVLSGAVGLVLLIACASVANLMLGATAARRKEVSIRTALGVSRFRILRQLLTESLLLALLGGSLGLLLAYFGSDFLAEVICNKTSGLVNSKLQIAPGVVIDSYVLGFTLVVSVLTGLLVGLAPAIVVSRLGVNGPPKERRDNAIPYLRQHRIRSFLVVSEVGLALILMIGAGLMTESFLHLRRVSPGINPEHVLTMGVFIPPAKYRDDREQVSFYDQVLRRLRAVPGVSSAGGIFPLPLSGMNVDFSFSIDGHPTLPIAERPVADYRAITPNYFRTMGIPLLGGRDFSEADKKGASGVVIINRAMARKFFLDENPIGKRLDIGDGYNGMREIVGVVGDVRHNGLDAQVKPEMYVSYLQRPWPLMTFAVRSDSDPEGLALALRDQVWATDKDQPITVVRSMEQALAESISLPRFYVITFAILAGVALALAAVGVYGTVSSFVIQERHELVTHTAPKALRQDVLKQVVRQVVILALIGVATGLVGALVLTRFMSRMVFGITTTDPATFAIASLLMTAIVLAACYVTALSAARWHPMAALRYQ